MGRQSFGCPMTVLANPQPRPSFLRCVDIFQVRESLQKESTVNYLITESVTYILTAARTTLNTCSL